MTTSTPIDKPTVRVGRAARPHTNRREAGTRGGGYDDCQTPYYAAAPLADALPRDMRLWEPARGAGILAASMRALGYEVVDTGLPDHDFLTDAPPAGVSAVVTNPPYSLKFEWIERCFELGLPWALLLPVDTLGAKRAQPILAACNVAVLLLPSRIDFIMPHAGLNGAGAHFPVAWFCGDLMDGGLYYANMTKPRRGDLSTVYPPGWMP